MSSNSINGRAFDVAIVGGGVNGTGIARDAAGRGLSVVLVEQNDLASATSSASTKLIHGGLRYLEHYEFGLVRKSLIEREVLLRNAPHIMWPLRFAMPHHPAMRPMWLIRLGVFLYDHLAKRNILPGSRAVSLGGHALGAPLLDTFTQALVYSDGWVDDARLTVLNAVDAAAHGAVVRTRTRCVQASASADGWEITCQNRRDERETIHANVLVNAAGPWAASFIASATHTPPTKSLRLVRGSHIVVKKLFEHDHAYIFQNPDNRIVFAIPYEHDFSLVGTTDVEELGDPGKARISPDETNYLLEVLGRYFKKPPTLADVVWSYSGVRPLIDDASGDPSKVTRDYELEWIKTPAPLLNVWGGKITTFRKLAEESVDILRSVVPTRRGAWTAHAPLPGGDLSALIPATGEPVADFAAFVQALATRYPKVAPKVLLRLARAYGGLATEILDAPLGSEIAPTVYEGELAYLRRNEWAISADDVLLRRSKLWLHLTPSQREAVRTAMGE